MRATMASQCPSVAAITRSLFSSSDAAKSVRKAAAGLGIVASASMWYASSVEEDGARNVFRSPGTDMLATSSVYPIDSIVGPHNAGGGGSGSGKRWFSSSEALSAAAPVGAAAKIEECDFVVVGNGRSGSAAIRSLRSLCPDAEIIVIDQLAASPPPGSDEKGKAPTYHRLSSSGLDPALHTVLLSDGSSVRYRHSVLLATGSRGAPPPPDLIDAGAAGRVLELRSTEAPPGPTVAPAGEGSRKPALSPQVVRQLTLMAASQGARICVLGSGLEAAELAAAAAEASSKWLQLDSGGQPSSWRTKNKEKNRKSSYDKDNSAKAAPGTVPPPRVFLVFGSAAPLSAALPRYLSAAVTKRFKRMGIGVVDRSLVRYVAMHENGLSPGQAPYLEVHTSKSYDVLDTMRIEADLLIVAPSVDGQRGTAVLSTLSDSNRPLFRAWSRLTPPSQPVLNCFVDDGRILVNAELRAASGIFAAGSVAKFPNSATGHASVAGEGVLAGSAAGEVAAQNMIKDYCERTAGASAKLRKGKEQVNTNLSFPSWRTDVSPLRSAKSDPQMLTTTSYLSSIGVHAICIGQCDSETMATHGFWWTNQALNRRTAILSQSSDKHGEQREAAVEPRWSTKRGLSVRRAVYGSGVVYYLDRAGTIRGVMMWGFPFAKRDGSTPRKELLKRMQNVIRTNGRVCVLKHAEAVEEQTGNAHYQDLLTCAHLSEESKLLALMSFNREPVSGEKSEERRNIFSRPLHRYTPSKPESVTSIGALQRNATYTGTGGVGEDMFIKKSFDDKERPQSLVYVYPLDSSSQVEFGYGEKSSGVVVNLEDDVKTSHYPSITHVDNLKWSRPSKEEPLWLRKGDAGRAISRNDVMADVFFQNIRHGRFYDGSEAIKQAPQSKSASGAS